MIFVTVGTHEQPFNRLIKKIDDLVSDGIINEKVYIQRGYSTYVPKNCEYSDFLSFNEMNDYMEKSRIVISHGGPATFMKALSLNKKTIVVPRLKEFDEHVNNHQLTFARQVASRGYGIIVVTSMDELGNAITRNSIDEPKIGSNNDRFVAEITKRIHELY